MLLGIGVGGKGGHRHGSRHPELIRHLLLVQTRALHRLSHPAAAFLLQTLKILLHLIVNGLRIVKQSLIALLPQRRRVPVQPVLVNGLELNPIVHVVLVLVKVRHLLPPAEQPLALLLFLFGLLLRLGRLWGLLRGRLRRRLRRLLDLRLLL